MTRPIYEPNTQRTEAFLDFGQQQLFRRPSPISASGLELPTAVMQCSDGITIADDTYTSLDADETGVEWTDGYINQAGLDMTPTGFDFDFHNGLITFSSSGVYIGQLQINWCPNTITTPPAYLLQDFIYFGNCAVTGNCGSWMSIDPLPTTDQNWQHGYYHSEGHWISVSDPDVLSSVKGAVSQRSGGSMDICTTTLIITRLCPFDANSGEFLPPSS